MRPPAPAYATALLVSLTAWGLLSSCHSKSEDRAASAPRAAAFAVRSTLTLEELERRSGVPVDHLIRELHLPGNVPTQVPLRRLVADLGLDMREVRRVVREYRASHPAG